MHEIGFSERKYARRRGGVFNFLLSHFSFQSILSRKSYEQYLSNLVCAGKIKKEKVLQILVTFLVKMFCHTSYLCPCLLHR